jgi:hypothetical protein
MAKEVRKPNLRLVTGRTIKVYGSYSFIDKDPIIDKVRTIVEDSGRSYNYIESKSGVTSATLNNWFNGKTKRPQHCTVAAVARCLGYSLEFKRR